MRRCFISSDSIMNGLIHCFLVRDWRVTDLHWKSSVAFASDPLPASGGDEKALQPPLDVTARPVQSTVKAFRLSLRPSLDTMKLLSLLVLVGLIASVLSSCTPARRAGWGYRPYGVYSSSVYEDQSGYWDVYQSRSSTRVKYNN